MKQLHYKNVLALLSGMILLSAGIISCVPQNNFSDDITAQTPAVYMVSEETVNQNSVSFEQGAVYEISGTGGYRWLAESRAKRNKINLRVAAQREEENTKKRIDTAKSRRWYALFGGTVYEGYDVVKYFKEKD